MARKKKDEPRSWLVKMRITYDVEVVCNGCTEEQAKADPFKYSSSETLQNLVDWEVSGTEPNT